jgi:hypothetical protein
MRHPTSEELRELNSDERLRLREELWNRFVDDEATFLFRRSTWTNLCAGVQISKAVDRPRVGPLM